MSLLGICLLACAAETPATDVDPFPIDLFDEQGRLPPAQTEFWHVKNLSWVPGQMVLQGFFGANLYNTVKRTGGSTPDVDGSDDSASQLPVIGGGAQWKLGGDDIDLGIEAMFAFSGRANATAFAAGGGGATIAVQIDMYLFEIYGGPVANVFLGDKARVYVAAGPLMEWVNYSQKDDADTIDDTSTGFGTGLYARTGIEFLLYEHTTIGLGVRYAESTIDLGNDLGNLDLDGYQVVLTVTEGF